MKIKQDISIGHNLKRLRSESKLSQEALAGQMQLYGCSTTRDIYAQMEAGKYNIRISELLVLKEIYHCELGDFFLDLPTPEMIRDGMGCREIKPITSRNGGVGK